MSCPVCDCVYPPSPPKVCPRCSDIIGFAVDEEWAREYRAFYEWLGPERYEQLVGSPSPLVPSAECEILG